MRALPMQHTTDSRLSRPTITKLPGGVVSKAIVRQTIDLKPYGNTVTVRTLADNPFEDRRPVVVVTQASGGMAKADPTQKSNRLVHAYLPGLGDAAVPATMATPAKPAGAIDFLATAANSAQQMYLAQQANQQAQANAASQSALARMAANMGASSLTTPLLIIGGGALAVGAFLYLRKKKKGRR